MNARAHNPRNIGMITNALHEVGAARSIVVDEDNVVLAGNGTIEAAAQAGIERVRFIDADGDELIAVRRSNLTPSQKTRLALFDNRSAELATWDPGVLTALQEDGADLSAFWYDDELLAVTTPSEPVVPTAGDPPSQELRAPCFVEVWCTRDDLNDFQPTLTQWSTRNGVTINIS